MFPHKFTFKLAVCFVLSSGSIPAQTQKAPPGGRVAIVVDERLSVLRASPDFSGKFVRRLGRGKLVAIRGAKRNKEGILFLFVIATRRTHGWVQSDAVVSPSRPQDDVRLLTLIRSATEFDRIVRAKIFLDYFRTSRFRAEVLLMMGDEAETTAAKLSRDAVRRIEATEGVPALSYYLNYVGLDRYGRQGIGFVFDEPTKRYHYNGAAWRQLVRRFPNSPEASEARKRLGLIQVKIVE